jgi:hypothetical protein
MREAIERKTSLNEGTEEQTMLSERIGADQLRLTVRPPGGDRITQAAIESCTKSWYENATKE